MELLQFIEYGLEHKKNFVSLNVKQKKKKKLWNKSYVDVEIDMRKTDYNGWIPKLIPVYRGYKGFDSGLCILWHGHFIYLIKPINER